MKLSIDDPKVKAYITGELSEEEARQLEQQLRENPEIADLVETLKRTAALISEDGEDRRVEPEHVLEPERISKNTVMTPAAGNSDERSEGGLQQFLHNHLGPSWRFGVSLISATLLGLLVLFVLIPIFKGKTATGIEKMESQFQKQLDQAEEDSDQFVKESTHSHAGQSSRGANAQSQAEARRIHQNTVKIFDQILSQRFETLSSERAQLITTYSKIQDRQGASENHSSLVPLKSDRESFSLHKNSIESGEIPAAHQVQQETIINGFSYGNASDAKDVIALEYEAGVAPWDTSKILLKLTILTPAQRDHQPRFGYNTILLDLMSSTEKSPPLLRFFNEALMQWLQDHSIDQQMSFTLAAATFSDIKTSFSTKAKDSIQAYLKKLNIQDRRDFENGLKVSVIRAKRNQAHRNNKILIVTTAGLQASDVSELARRWEQNPDIKFSAMYLGVAPTPVISQLRRLILNEGGRFYQAITPTDIDTALSDHFDVKPAVVENLKLKLDFNLDVVKGFRIKGYDSSENIERMDDERIWLPANYTHTTIYEIDPGEDWESGSDEVWAKIYLSFSKPGHSSSEYKDYSLTAKDVSPLSQTSPAFRLAAAVSHYARLLQSGLKPESKAEFRSIAPLLESVIRESSSQLLKQEAENFQQLYRKTGEILNWGNK